jgi:phosphoglycolate phosphatase-like HAD superfamily hydrolase
MSPGLDRARIRAVCFDIDGTLADTDDAIVIRLARYLGPLARLTAGRDPTRLARGIVLASEGPANALYALADRLGLDEVAGPLLNAFHSLRGEGRPSHFALIPGAREALAQLHQAYPLAIVSSRDQRGVLAFLEQSALASFFRVVASARTCRRTKPHPAPVVWAAGRLGVPPDTCLMVGDTIVDVIAGRLAGAQTAGVLCGFGQREELERAGADVVVSTPSDLVPLLLG